MKSPSLPTWFPNPNSWLNALMLIVSVSVTLTMITKNLGSDFNVPKWSDSPEKFTVYVILWLILPIVAIAIIHHFLIGRVIKTFPGESSATNSIFPGAISWWSSLYAWLVVILSTLIATLVCTPFLPLFGLNYSQISVQYPDIGNVRLFFAAIWLLCAAMFYQIAYISKYRLMSGEDLNSEPEISLSNEITTSEDETQTAPNTKMAVTKSRKNSARNFIVIVFVGLISAWLYSFLNLPQVQTTISSGNIAQKIQSRIVPPPKANSKSLSAVTEDDSFIEAVNLAQSAIKLEKYANTPSEWNLVVGKWKAAVALMKSVPPSSPNFIFAEQKLAEYQSSLKSAQKQTAKLGMQN